MIFDMIECKHQKEIKFKKFQPDSECKGCGCTDVVMSDKVPGYCVDCVSIVMDEVDELLRKELSIAQYAIISTFLKLL